eukprot:gb/GECH01006465.1/.p1 GENE.gb/GECH01006465.1/~~gb/GECH01006465.1/.p1  ORF type:complete len:321 (+),score=69.56 gb/GECH01006465.1/:1-963(+)
MIVISGSANRDLAKKIGEFLDSEVGHVKTGVFADGEIDLQVGESVRGQDVFAVQPTCPPVNHNLMELYLMTDALRRASAHRVTAVIPYYGYARQDRKSSSRVPISAALVAQLLEAAGVHRVLAVDLHCGQIQGFFRIPVDHLYASPVLYSVFQHAPLHNPVIAAPDSGATERALYFRKGLEKLGFENVGFAVMNKQRRPNEPGKLELVGNVSGSDVIIVDDMIDTAGTLCSAAQLLKDNGARKVYACATHPLFSGDALNKIKESCLERVYVTDTIPLKEECSKICVVSMGHLLAEAIRRVHNEESVSGLFNVVLPTSGNF